VLVKDREHFLSTKDFPFFADARLRDIFAVELWHDRFLRWPALDVDLELEAIENPQACPLIARQGE
jgi:hypothetical protein